jgi:hypothetical protein
MNADETSGMTRWCAGLPFKEERALTEEEMRRLTLLHRYALRVRLLAGGLIFPTLAAACFISWKLHIRPVLLTPDTDISRPPGLFSTLTSAAVLLEIWLCLRYSGRARAIQLDLQSGLAEVYSGVLAERSRMEPTQQRLLASGVLSTDATRLQSLELLKCSHILWRVNGICMKRLIQPALTQVAAQPAFAAIAAQWLEPVSRQNEAVLYGGRRELSPEEKGELRSFVKRLVVRPATTTLPVSCLSLLLASELYRDHPIDTDGLFWIFVIGGIFNVALYLFQITQARRFMADLNVGYVGIRRIETLGPVPHMEPDIEFLPVTGMLWTRSGQPAAWRRGSR